MHETPVFRIVHMGALYVSYLRTGAAVISIRYAIVRGLCRSVYETAISDASILSMVDSQNDSRCRRWTGRCTPATNTTLSWGRLRHRRIMLRATVVSETSPWSSSNEYKKTQTKTESTLEHFHLTSVKICKIQS